MTEDQRLRDVRVVITRPRAQASAFADALASRGATPLCCPLIHIVPPPSWGPLDAACAALRSDDWIVLTSHNAVEALVGRADAIGARPLLARARLCAIGQATSARLTAHGLHATLTPEAAHADAALAALLDAGVGAGSRVVLPRADIGRDILADGLRAAGADVVDVVAYQTQPVTPDDADVALLRSHLRDPRTVLTFTSPSAVRQFVTVLGQDAARQVLTTRLIAAIGETTATEIRAAGGTAPVVPTEATVASLAEALAVHVATHGLPRA